MWPQWWSSNWPKNTSWEIPYSPVSVQRTTQVVGRQRKPIDQPQCVESSPLRFEEAFCTWRKSRHSVEKRMGWNHPDQIWWESHLVHWHHLASGQILWQNRTTKDWQDHELSPYRDICAHQRHDTAVTNCGCHPQVCYMLCSYTRHNAHIEPLGRGTSQTSDSHYNTSCTYHYTKL